MGALDIAVLDGIEANAAELRAGLEAMQPGVVDLGDFKVTPRAAGANRSIDLAAGRAVLQTPLVTMPYFLGRRYLVAHEAAVNSDAFELGGIAAPHASFARLDQIILRAYDNEGGQRRWRPEVLTGVTPTLNATLDNRHNAAALPTTGPVLRVADLVVPTTGIITAAEIRDRRPYAKGALHKVLSTAGGTLTSNTTWSDVHASLSRRVECSGRAMRVLVPTLRMSNAQAAAYTWIMRIAVNGAAPTGDTTDNHVVIPFTGAINSWYGITAVGATFTPPAGSNLISLQHRNDAGAGVGASYYHDAATPIVMTIEEFAGRDSINA